MIKPSSRRDKRFMLVMGDKAVHFGSASGETFIDHGDLKKRENYIKRHGVNEDWGKINPGSLSRFILWGDSKNINKNIIDYKKRFNI